MKQMAVHCLANPSCIYNTHTHTVCKGSHRHMLHRWCCAGGPPPSVDLLLRRSLTFLWPDSFCRNSPPDRITTETTTRTSRAGCSTNLSWLLKKLESVEADKQMNPLGSRRVMWEFPVVSSYRGIFLWTKRWDESRDGHHHRSNLYIINQKGVSTVFCSIYVLLNTVFHLSNLHYLLVKLGIWLTWYSTSCDV